HCDDNPACTSHQVHGAADPLHHFAGNHPIRDVSFLIHFHGTQHAQIDMAATDHSKRIGAREIGGPRQLAHGFLACVDEVGVLLTLDWIRPNTEHAIFTLQNYVHAWWNVVCNQGWHSDAKVYIETIAQLLSDPLHDAFALFNI